MKYKKVFLFLSVVSLSLIICACNKNTSDQVKGQSMLFPVEQNGKYGYIDDKGNIVVNPQFDWGGSFSEDMAVIKTGNKYGYIDNKGNIIINPKFDKANLFADGLAVIMVNDGKVSKYGYIDNSGKYVIEPKYDWADSFFEGYAEVILSGKHKLIDNTGKIMFDDKFNGVSKFSNGLAAVSYDVGKKSNLGYINKNGDIVINIQCYRHYAFSEELAAVNIKGKWGFIDKNGAFVIEPKFSWVNSFSEGLAAVYDGIKWGFIDKTGQYVIEPKYKIVQDFSEGLAAVYIGNKWGFIDAKGETVVNPQYDIVNSFAGGLARIIILDKNCHEINYISKNGEPILDHQITNKNEIVNAPRLIVSGLNEDDLIVEDLFIFDTQATVIEKRGKPVSINNKFGTSYIYKDIEIYFWSDEVDSKIKLVRILSPNIATYRGVCIGDPIEKIENKYGMQNNSSNEVYWYISSGEQIKFYTKNGKVEQISLSNGSV